MQAHVVTDARLDLEVLGLAPRGVPEALLARELELDAATTHLMAEPCVERLEMDILLGAKAAADVGLDHADAAPGNAEGLADDATADVRDLCRRDADDLAALLVAVRDTNLDVRLALLTSEGLNGEVVVLGVEKCVLDALVAHLPELLLWGHGKGVRDDVVGLALLDGHLGALHGLARVVDDGVLLVLDVDQAQRALGSNVVLGHDGCDVVSVNAHAVVQQPAVGDVALGRRGVRIPGVACDRIGEVGHVEAGEHTNDAGNLLRLVGVDRDDAAVSNGGVEYLCHQAGLGAEVIGKHRAARDLVVRVDALYGPTDLLIALHLSLLSYKRLLCLKKG